MHPEDIKAELRKLGFKQYDAARYLGVSPSVVTGVIEGTKASFRVASWIAEMIGRDINEVFPGRYAHRLRKAAA